MYKRLLGIAIVIVLASIVIFNLIEKNNEASNSEKNTNEVDVSGDTDVEGGMIVSPDQSGIEEGEVAPDFELESLTGEKVKLSDFQGKKVIINFWATWCGPCRKEMPEMQKFYDAYRDEVEILAVNLTGTETSEKDAEEFIDKYEYTYPSLLDKSLRVRDDYMAIAVPTSYFIGTDGKVQSPRKVGPMTYDYMEETLQTID